MFLPFPVLMFIEFRENASAENRQRSKANFQGGSETIEITSMTEIDGSDMVIETTDIRCDKKNCSFFRAPVTKFLYHMASTYITGVITQQRQCIKAKLVKTDVRQNTVQLHLLLLKT